MHNAYLLSWVKCKDDNNDHRQAYIYRAYPSPRSVLHLFDLV